MARKLPWLSTSTKPSKDPAPTSRPVKRRKTSRPDSPSKDDSDNSSTCHPTRKGAKESRNPSSSPPPSAPQQEYMRSGLENDDIWVMVEDEFLFTAHLYTSHLHKAEYLRLKNLARAQNASTIQKIARSVDERTEQSVESRKKMEAQLQRAVQAAAMTNLQGSRQMAGRGEDEDEEEDPWMQDPRLAGLMTQREMSTQLSRITGTKSGTRASRGYGKASEARSERRADENQVPPVKPQPRPASRVIEEDADADSQSDDLGVPSKTYKNAPSKPLPKARILTKNDTSTTPLPTTKKRIDSVHSLKTKTSNEATVPTDLANLSLFPHRQPLPRRIGAKLGARKDSPKGEGRTVKVEEVPTFLF